MSMKRPYQKPKITPSASQIDPQEYWDCLFDMGSDWDDYILMVERLDAWLSSGGHYPVVTRPRSVLKDKVSNRVYVRTVLAFLLSLEEGS